MMNWLKENGFTAFLTVCVALTLLIVVQSIFESKEYGTIKVKGGDTLLSLAETYRGEMDRDAWILEVKKQNSIMSDRIAAGEQLAVPVGKNHHEIEVASNK